MQKTNQNQVEHFKNLYKDIVQNYKEQNKIIQNIMSIVKQRNMIPSKNNSIMHQFKDITKQIQNTENLEIKNVKVKFQQEKKIQIQSSHNGSMKDELFESQKSTNSNSDESFLEYLVQNKYNKRETINFKYQTSKTKRNSVDYYTDRDRKSKRQQDKEIKIFKTKLKQSSKNNIYELFQINQYQTQNDQKFFSVIDQKTFNKIPLHHQTSLENKKSIVYSSSFEGNNQILKNPFIENLLIFEFKQQNTQCENLKQYLKFAFKEVSNQEFCILQNFVITNNDKSQIIDKNYCNKELEETKDFYFLKFNQDQQENTHKEKSDNMQLQINPNLNPYYYIYKIIKNRDLQQNGLIQKKQEYQFYIIQTKYPFSLSIKNVLIYLSECFFQKPSIQNQIILNFVVDINKNFLTQEMHSLNLSGFDKKLEMEYPISFNLIEVEPFIYQFFDLLSFENFMIILLSMLSEKTIIFVSQNDSKLTTAISILHHLIKPFAWQFPCIYNLPKEQYIVLGSPIPLIAGIKETHKNFIEKVIPEYCDCTSSNNLFVFLDEDLILMKFLNIASISLPQNGDVLSQIRKDYYSFINKKQSQNTKIHFKKSQGYYFSKKNQDVMIEKLRKGQTFIKKPSFSIMKIMKKKSESMTDNNQSDEHQLNDFIVNIKSYNLLVCQQKLTKNKEQPRSILCITQQEFSKNLNILKLHLEANLITEQ